jgi:hypothetical protein
MDEDRRKLMLAVEEEIARICGGEMEYVAWLGKAAAMLTATMATCKKLMELAEAQGRPFEDKVKIQIAFLGWFGNVCRCASLRLRSVARPRRDQTSLEGRSDNRQLRKVPRCDRDQPPVRWARLSDFPCGTSQ